MADKYMKKQTSNNKSNMSEKFFINKRVLFYVIVPITSLFVIAIALMAGYLIGFHPVTEAAQVAQVEAEAEEPMAEETSEVILVEDSEIANATTEPEEVAEEPEETDQAPSTSTSSSSYGRLQRTSDAGDAYYDSLYYLGGVEISRLALHTGIPNDHVFAKDDGFTQLSAINDARFRVDGVSGYLTAPQALGVLKPKAVVISFGYNGAPYMSVDTFIYYYKELVEQIQKETPSTKIVIQMCYPITYSAEQAELLKTRDEGVGQYTNEKIHEINSRLQGLAKELKVYYMAQDGIVKINDEVTAPLDPAYALDDGMRLTKEGNERVAEYIREHKIPNY